MDFCNLDFGFIDIPSLFVFINPWSPYQTVQNMLVDDFDIKKVRNYLALAKPSEETTDMINRISSFVHERKHFHDILLTPCGNRLVREAFLYAITTSALFLNRNWSKGGSIEIPLQSQEGDLVLSRVTQRRNDMFKAIESAKSIFETLAVMAQEQFVWSVLGENAVDVFETGFSLKNISPKVYADYSRWLDVFSKALGDSSNWDIGEIANLQKPLHLNFLCMLGDGQLPPGCTTRSGLLMELFEKIKNRSLAEIERALNDNIKSLWPQFLDGIYESERSNRDFALRIGHLLREYPEEMIAGAQNVFNDFCVKSEKIHCQFLEKPDIYLGLPDYTTLAGDDMPAVEPYLYLYSMDDMLSLFPNSLNLQESELNAQVEFKDPRTGLTSYSYRMCPALNWSYNESPQRKMWVEFVQSMGGSAALLDEIDFLHPLKTYWLKTMEQLDGVKFVRKM
jgi:hypothetical protein